MPATLQRFTERAIAPIGRVDKTAGVIHDVRIIGTKSRNCRTYTHEALSSAVGKYEGVHVNVDHPKSSELDEDRKFDDWAGVLKHVTYRDGALYGDLHLRRSSRWFDQIVEAAAEFPNSFGLSHVADGDSRFDSGEEIVESIQKVFSVDIVLKPATNRGLFESFDLDSGASDISLFNCGDRVGEVVGQLAALAARSPHTVPADLLATCVETASICVAIQMNEQRLEKERMNQAPLPKVAESSRRTPPAGTEEHEFAAPWMKRESKLDDDIRRAFVTQLSSPEDLERFANRLR